MNERIDTMHEFTLMSEARSFVHAWKGVVLFLKMTKNAWVHLGMFSLVLLLGFFFHISRMEWLIVIFAGGLVLVAEAFNTAIEIDINLTSPTYHPYARDTKDVSAGAVLIASGTAFIIGIIVFLPYL